MSNLNNKPLVTIAIPTYNSADKYLSDSISSALAQDYQNLEILVSDNCSTDDTFVFMQSINDNRLRYIRQKNNLGANNNFNYCLNEAKGSYILFLCDDDLIDADFISTCINHISKVSGHSFIRTGVRVIDSNGATIRERTNIVNGDTPKALFQAWFAHSTSWYLCNTLFNKRFLQEIGGLQSIHNVLEDCYAIAKLASRRDWVDIVDIKASCRKYPEQKTFALSIKTWCEDFLGLLDLMCEQLNGDAEEFRKQGKRYFGGLCRARACALSTRRARFIAGAFVARYFGVQYFPLRGVLKAK
jgi:glycosyltransferase involved in cell wall biosynthesis